MIYYIGPVVALLIFVFYCWCLCKASKNREEDFNKSKEEGNDRRGND